MTDPLAPLTGLPEHRVGELKVVTTYSDLDISYDSHQQLSEILFLVYPVTIYVLFFKSLWDR